MRQGVLDSGLDKLGARALVVAADSSRDTDFAVFGGGAHLGRCFLVAARGRPPVLTYTVDMERDEAAATGFELVAPSSDEIAELRRHGASESEIPVASLVSALESVGIANGVLALAGHPTAGQALLIIEALEDRGYALCDGQALMAAVRKTKSEEEASAVRAAAAATCAAFRRVAAVLAGAGRRGPALLTAGAPLTAGILRREIAVVLASEGLEQPLGNIVAAGSEAGVPHTQGADRKEIRVGEPIVVDLYPKGRLFADCTRTFCVGQPAETVTRAHALCSKALAQARAAAAPGVLGIDLQEGVCRLFEEAGFATVRSQPGTRSGYVHGLGHGVGYELHELPSFRASSAQEGELAAGDVFTLEPGLYDPEAGYGLRLEDLFLMTPEGPENLTPLPYELDPALWRD